MHRVSRAHSLWSLNISRILFNTVEGNINDIFYYYATSTHEAFLILIFNRDELLTETFILVLHLLKIFAINHIFVMHD